MLYEETIHTGFKIWLLKAPNSAKSLKLKNSANQGFHPWSRAEWIIRPLLYGIPTNIA